VLVNGFALTDTDAWNILLEYNARCLPPWNERDLRHKLSDARKGPHQRPAGYLLGEKEEIDPPPRILGRITLTDGDIKRGGENTTSSDQTIATPSTEAPTLPPDGLPPKQCVFTHQFEDGKSATLIYTADHERRTYEWVSWEFSHPGEIESSHAKECTAWDAEIQHYFTERGFKWAI
jgi:hypothetical protein